MKKYIFYFLLYFSLHNVHAQRVYIFDRDSSKPISFANINYFKADNIINSNYSNESGLIDIKDTNSFDRIEVSCIGYENKSISMESIKDTIYLTKKIISLDEVVIPKKKDVLLYGYSKFKKKIGISGAKGMQVCAFVENPSEKEKFIKSFLFKIKRSEKYKTAIRIHFYKKATDKIYPGEEILTENIIKYLNGKTKGIVEVDISMYGIELPAEGAFVGVEWLGILDEKTGEFIENKENWSDTSIEYNDAINEPLTFIKSRLKKNTWSNTENLKKDFESFDKFKNYPNASFGIEVFND
ncbi:hypothetical protein [Flavobacterium sp. FlaQc-50]|jgi:hypothetical protein|uniref:hypothetical protein n=1 Tax=unclassified Flavobacterium TaxID=196869 RepID=UPI0037572C24